MLFAFLIIIGVSLGNNMDITVATNFVTSTLLVSIACCIAAGCAILINNMIHRWWKPLSWSIVPQSIKDVISGNFEQAPKDIKETVKQEPHLENTENSVKQVRVKE
jgi:hypothetical protein